jgi:hypothetical protein
VRPAARGRSPLATRGIATSANTCPSAAHSLVLSSPMPTSTQRSATPSASKLRRNEPPTISSEPGTSRVGDRSTISTSIPAWRSAIALLSPAGPAPTISTFDTATIAPPNQDWASRRRTKVQSSWFTTPGGSLSTACAVTGPENLIASWTLVEPTGLW